jgi:CheY-like chemotaxis protein
MEEAPDIVLMDVSLEGDCEGIEVARWLREVCDVPIIFITGYTDPDTIERIHEVVRELLCCPNWSVMIGSRKPWQRCVSRARDIRRGRFLTWRTRGLVARKSRSMNIDNSVFRR